MSPFIVKDWKDYNPSTGEGDPSTPATAAAMKDLEQRLSAYTDTSGALGLINVKAAPYGAKADGVTDDAPAINAALTSCPSGGIVFMPPGTYAVKSPLVVPPNVTLEGTHGNRINYKFAAEWPGVPQTSIIKPLALFSGPDAINGVVRLLDIEQGSYSGESVGQRLLNFTVDGALLTPGTPVDGVRATGKVREVIVDRVACQYMPRGGIVTATFTRADASVVYPYSWYVSNSIARSVGNFGFSFPGLTDSHIFNCQNLGGGSAGVSGFFLSGLANTHVTDCRSEWSKGHGFLITGSTSNGGAIFTGLSTDRNEFDGIHVDCTGNAPLIFNGLMLRRDGRNGKGGGGGYAGFSAQNATAPIIVTGITVYPGQDDDATGTFSPANALRVTSLTAAQIHNGYLHGFVGAVQNDGGHTNLFISNQLTYATGSPFSPTITKFAAA